MRSLCHAYSADDRIPASAAFDEPVLAAGWDITYATPDGPGVAAGLARGVHHRTLPMSRRLDPLGDLRGLAALTTLFLRERYTLVHTHNAKVGIVARLAATAARVPAIVHTVHGFPFHPDEHAKRAAYVAAERLANVRTDAILTQSDEDTETLRALRVIDPARIVYVGNGVDLTRFDGRPLDDVGAARRDFGLPEHAILFTCAARLRLEKGIEELLEAASLARREHPAIRVVLAGEPDEGGRNAISRERLDRARAEGDFVLGHVRDIPRLYAASDVVTLPSWFEGLPRALVEGAAMGKPLLATDVPGNREVLRAPMVGRLVPARSPRDLAAAMVAMARELPRLDGSRNRRSAHERYDVRVAARRIAEVYERLVPRDAPRVQR